MRSEDFRIELNKHIKKDGIYKYKGRSGSHYLIKDLDEQGKFLNAYLDSRAYDKPTDFEILLLKKPSSEKYVIFRSLWDYGFNPTQKDWVYNYIFLSRHLAEKTNRDLTLNLHELFYILKNE